MLKETLTANVSGIVAQVYAPTGTLVKENELILQIECMKCYFDIVAGINGKLELIIKPGEYVQELQELGYITEVS